ncbi:hypothetical protein D3C87_894430 [compost metagenome]
MLRPTPTEPVKLIAWMPGWLTSASPITLPRPITRLNTPAGMPERLMISASAQAQPGTRSAGLSTTQLPKASAGAIFQAGIAMGKFHGVMSPTTPTGSRVISTPMFGRTDGSTSPDRRRHSPAKNLKICPARVASPMPSALVLPSSRASSVPSSSLRARISVPILSSASERAWMLPVAQAGKAAVAAATAASTWPLSPCVYWPSTSARLLGLMLGL